MKYIIEKNTVQETLIIPLYARKLAMEYYPGLFHDEECIRLCDSIDYAYEGKTGLREKVGALMGAQRQYDMASCCKKYLAEHQFASVVNLGCGLDTTFYQIDNGTAKSFCLDMSDVITMRRELLPERERETCISCDLNDTTWFEKIEFEPEKGAVFFASGVFYYFFKEDIIRLVSAMAERFPGGLLCFDATTEKGIKGMQKTWLKLADIQVGTYFYLMDAEREVSAWSDHISKVTKKGYMTAYRPLQKEYGFIPNLVFRIFEATNSGQLIEVEFSE